MLSLYLLALVGLVRLTDPSAFSKLCSSTGECPAGWIGLGRDCLKLGSRDMCEEGMESLRHVKFVDKTAVRTLYCLVTRETQCQCGRVDKDREREYPWQGRSNFLSYLFTEFECSVDLSVPGGTCGGSIISRDKILTAAHCTVGKPTVLSVFCEIINQFVDQSLDDITVSLTRKEKRVRLSVCGKREHPGYNTTARRDKDIVILQLCQPLMFSKGLPIPN